MRVCYKWVKRDENARADAIGRVARDAGEDVILWAEQEEDARVVAALKEIPITMASCWLCNGDTLDDHSPLPFICAGCFAERQKTGFSDPLEDVHALYYSYHG